MNTPLRLAGFGVVLAAMFGTAWGVGAATGTAVAPVPAGHGGAASAPHDGGHGGAGNNQADASSAATVDVPGGLMVAQSGYRLDVSAEQPPGQGRRLALRILLADGRALTAFEESHDKRLHLIVVRRDLTGFQHVHPQMAADGTWTVPVDLTPGTWRVFADFVPGAGQTPGDTVTLGGDLQVPGAFQPRPLPAAATTTTVDGYTVKLDGQLTAGGESKLALSVSRDGRPVTDLQPYLAAYGHLVVLRAGDLAYLHVHPAGSLGDGTTTAGPQVEFYATAPSPGRYRLYLDFQHQGTVRTAELTVDVGPRPAGPPTSGPPASSPSPAGGTPPPPAATPTAEPSATRPAPSPDDGDHGADGHGHG